MDGLSGELANLLGRWLGTFCFIPQRLVQSATSQPTQVRERFVQVVLTESPVFLMQHSYAKLGNR